MLTYDGNDNSKDNHQNLPELCFSAAVPKMRPFSTEAEHS